MPAPRAKKAPVTIDQALISHSAAAATQKPPYPPQMLPTTSLRPTQKPHSLDLSAPPSPLCSLIMPHSASPLPPRLMPSPLSEAAALGSEHGD